MHRYKSPLNLLVIILAIANLTFAQVSPIDFESTGNGADWTWTSFENDSNPPLAIVANPSATGANTSATVATYTALVTGQPWAGCESQHGADIGTFSLNASNATIKIMVYKPVISDVGIKLTKPDGWSMGEIKIPNTVINEWEELTFDFSSQIQDGYDQIVIFPDFDLDGRSGDNTCYFDNISFSGQELPPGPAAHAPFPTVPQDSVLSIFSDGYTNIAGTNFYPDWGQTTTVSEVLIEENNTLLYAGLNFQGMELGSAQDVSSMDSLRLDYWSVNSTELEVFLISQSSGEHSFVLPVPSDRWLSVGIPLTAFSDQGLTLSDIFQLKFVGNGDVYLDNIFFQGEVIVVSSEPNAPIDFEPEGYGADWTWTAFENSTNPPVEIVVNPNATGINTSATVASFTALATGAAWAGCESQHGADIGTFNLSAGNSTVKVMVYKPVVSDVGIKFTKPDGWSMGEIKIANTRINEWEELTFDFSSQVQDGYDQIVIFPDFDLNGRTTDNLCYFDNITFSGQEIPTGPEAHAPIPTMNDSNVISLFSNAYTDVTVDTWSAAWDVADVEDTQVEGDDAKLYTGLNYAGIEFVSQTVNANEMTHFHMDIWTADPSDLPAVFKMKLVDFGADGAWSGGDDVEHELIFDASSTPPLATGSWISYDLPLDDFSSLTTREHLAQLIISGDPNTVYVDNIYFYSDVVGIETQDNLRPSTLVLEQNFPNPFNPQTTIAFQLIEADYVTLNVYNISGQLVVNLVNQRLTMGTHTVAFNGSNLPSGSYYYSITAGETKAVKKMLLLK